MSLGANPWNSVWSIYEIPTVSSQHMEFVAGSRNVLILQKCFFTCMPILKSISTVLHKGNEIKT